MTYEEIQAFWETVNKFKMDHPDYMQTLDILSEYHRLFDKSKPQYVILSGSSSLPFRWNPGGWFEQYQPESEAR